MSEPQMHVVTGAYGYSGKRIARRLLERGHRVKTLTNSPQRENPFGTRIEALPFNFDEPEKLKESLRGAAVLYNTYWVRFNHTTFGHASAVENSFVLFEAAKEAGVERIVHVSITNPSLGSTLEYFSGKAKLEEALMATGVPHAILRPTVLFGEEDILVNNIAWMLRKFPVFGVFGHGSYRLQPIYVEDLAQLAVEQGERRGNAVINAIGPETFTYREMVTMIGQTIGKPRPIIRISPVVGYLVGRLVSLLVNDVLVTREEIEGLMTGLLYVDSPPTGETRLTDWARQNANSLGRRYTSELSRRRNRQLAYQVN